MKGGCAHNPSTTRLWVFGCRKGLLKRGWEEGQPPTSRCSDFSGCVTRGVYRLRACMPSFILPKRARAEGVVHRRRHPGSRVYRINPRRLEYGLVYTPRSIVGSLNTKKIGRNSLGPRSVSISELEPPPRHLMRGWSYERLISAGPPVCAFQRSQFDTW